MTAAGSMQTGSHRKMRHLMSGRIRHGIAGALWACLLFGVTPTLESTDWGVQAAHAQSASTQLDTIETDLGRIESSVLEAEFISSKFSAEDRLGDARIAHGLGQYDRASYLFLDVISRTSSTSFPGYREALYLLADSLYQQRNYIGARTYLKQLRGMGPGEYYQEGLGKLLEIAYATNNYDGIETIYNELGSSNKPGLAYLRAKTLYEQERYTDAAQAFTEASKDKEFAYKATYFAGVALVEAGKLDEATARFNKLSERVPEGLDDYHIYNLAHMALGRVAYEQERYEEALNHYATVDRRDEVFISAMYESAWANIQLGKFEQAQNMIDILISAEPDVDTYTKAMLLGADLAQRNKKYERALAAYESLLERYDPVRTQLFAFAMEREDLKGYFQGLIRDDLTLQIPPGLPNVRTDFNVMPPSEWLTDDDQLTRTRELIDDVALVRANLRSAYEDLRQLEARLGSGARVKSFPKLSANMAQMSSVESRLIDVQQDLVDQQAAQIASRLSGDDATAWTQMKQELDVLKSRYADIPQDVEQLKAREKKVNEDFKQLRERLGEVGVTLDELKAELSAIETYMQTQELLFSEEERTRVEALRQELRDAMVVLDDEEQALRAELNVMRERISGGNTLALEERELRLKYQEKLAAAADFFARRRSSAKDPSALASVEQAQSRIPSMTGRIQGFYTKMDGFVGDRTTDVRQTIENLKMSLDEQRAALDDAVATSRLVAGDLAYRTFMTRAYEFDQIVLRADVGKIDVLFTQKESTTEDINELYQKRTDELRALQEAFDELR